MILELKDALNMRLLRLGLICDHQLSLSRKKIIPQASDVVMAARDWWTAEFAEVKPLRIRAFF